MIIFVETIKNRTIMNNSAFIKKNYKQSTITRMKSIFGFKTLQDIDNSKVVTEALKIFDVFGNNPRFSQEILFDQIDYQINIENKKLEWQIPVDCDGDLPF